MNPVSILLCGCNGRMGKAVQSAVARHADAFTVTVGVDIAPAQCSFPVYPSVEQVRERTDVLVDFSHHSALPSLCAYAKANRVPLVVCSTGHTEEELELLTQTSKEVAVFRSGNMSLGVNLLLELVKKAAAVLGEDFDVEIIEKHHNKKLDAPSGTALMLADAAAGQFEGGKDYVFDRHSVRRERNKREIGISSVRGGNIVGEHEVLFCGENETLTLSHQAASREVFADGALKAAAFMADRAPGFYSMSDVLAEALG